MQKIVDGISGKVSYSRYTDNGAVAIPARNAETVNAQTLAATLADRDAFFSTLLGDRYEDKPARKSVYTTVQISF